MRGEGNGVDAFAHSYFHAWRDAGPYLTAATWITKDPDDGVQNMGVYRGNLKAPDRIAVMMLISLSAGGYYHWKKYQARGEKMPVCIVLGCPPMVEFTGPQKLQIGQDELAVRWSGRGADQRRACEDLHLMVPRTLKSSLKV